MSTVGKWILAGVLAVFLLYPMRVNASLTDKSAANLEIKTGQNLRVRQEELNIKLHVGFAEVEQILTVENPQEAQEAVFGLWEEPTEQTNFANLQALADDIPLDITAAKEAPNDKIIFWKTFKVNFPSKTGRKITVKYWTQNNADLNGWRGFNYRFKSENAFNIDKLKINLTLMDQIRPESFLKEQNPDLDLKLEPLGYETTTNKISWSWQNLTPGFNLTANFYWPRGDLTKIARLNQNLSLYDTTASVNSAESWQAADSSFLTAWQGEGELTLTFDKIRRIGQISILPTKIDSAGPIEAWFDDDQKEVLDLKNELAFQSFDLAQTRQTKTIKLVFGNDVSIAEVEANEKTAVTTETADGSQTPTKKNIFVRFWNSVSGLIKRIF